MGTMNVIYEDNHIIVVEKEPNIPVQEDVSKDKDMLTIIKEYLKEKYNKQGNVYLGLVHRLDRPVGGIMVFAKTSKAASRLSNEIRQNKLKKVYYAVVDGKLEPKDGMFKDMLLKDKKNNIVKVDKNGKEAILYYRVIKYKDGKSLVEINLKTGRSHQIRVQFSERGFPLVGDQKYNRNTKKGIQIALFSKTIGFIHPVKKEYMEFSLDLPNRYPFNIFNN